MTAADFAIRTKGDVPSISLTSLQFSDGSKGRYSLIKLSSKTESVNISNVNIVGVQLLNNDCVAVEVTSCKSLTIENCFFAANSNVGEFPPLSLFTWSGKFNSLIRISNGTYDQVLVDNCEFRSNSVFGTIFVDP